MKESSVPWPAFSLNYFDWEPKFLWMIQMLFPIQLYVLLYEANKSKAKGGLSPNYCYYTLYM